tara:strand:- start:21302 stop:22144 length:843 start_codon:yes stop_codon:yes gene_type:complete
MKYSWHNTKKIDKANVVIFGVKSESGSHAKRKGASKGPNSIRKASYGDIVIRKGKKSFEQPQDPINKKIFDYGNVRKKKLSKLTKLVSSKNKIPVVLGGDHSITFEALKGINEINKKFSIIYFDAHPDFVCSSNLYYGSVVCDSLTLKNIKFKNSLEIGLRAIEKEEFMNIKKKKINVFNAVDIKKLGINNVLKKIKKITKKPIYLSVDMDVVDPAFAPGVDTPVPGGLTSNELIYLCKEIAKLGLIGFDIMEVSPKYDIQNRTSHLASKLIIEIISSLK